MAIFTPSSNSEGDHLKLKLVYFSNELPNSELPHLFRQLLNHSKDDRHAILARFIDRATSAIRDEAQQLPPAYKALVPPFETILDFVDHRELIKGPIGGAVEGVLLCTIELAALIGYFERSPATYDFNSASTCLAGLGIGLLASAAVALSPTLTDIPFAGSEVLRIAFRMGILVDEISSNLQPRDQSKSPDSWATVIPDVAPHDVQKELDAMHFQEKTPEASKIFISGLSSTSVTVSGPPARLKRLFLLSGFFRDRRFVNIPVFGGLCHAEHIYNRGHVQTIVQTGTIDQLNSILSPVIPVLSTSTGKSYSAKSAKDLFENIILELMTQKIQWNNVVRELVEHARTLAATDLQVFMYHRSVPIHDLLVAMQTELEDVQASTEDLLPWISKTATEGGKPRGTMQSKIAIIGMACRMPGGATDTEKFWELLDNGLDVHRRIPSDRFDVETHYSLGGKRMNTSGTPYGCFIEEPGLFDAPFFNMSPREAQQTDPMQRLAIVTAYEALEKAGYVANRTSATKLNRIGTFYGQASDDYREVNTAQEISTYFIPGGCRAFGPGRINYFFKFSGPSFSCDTACSSSLATIQAACTSLWSGDTDTVVAGGMNVLTNSDAFAGLFNGHFLSQTPNACKTWDCEADGYCRGDGVGSIVMKRLEDAETDNDNILGIIRASATNHSAEAISITHPHAGHQAFLYRQVLSRAGIDPLDVNYVELHGTGTQAGDAEEIKGITDVFAPIKSRRHSRQPLHIGAVKSNVGHGEAAAGVTALIKVLLMLQKGAIPPHAGIKNSINPEFPKNLDERNLHIPFENHQWPQIAGQKKVAVVNNFSAAGGNTTLLVEEAPRRETSVVDPRSTHVIAVSAKSKGSMKGNLERLINYLNKNPEILLADLAYSTTARRIHHNHRVAVAATDLAQVKKQLTHQFESVEDLKAIPATGPPPVAFAFTGQGASYRSMNLGLYHDSPFFQSQMLHLDLLARRQGFASIIPAVDGSHEKDYTHSLVTTHLTLVCTEIALAKYWAFLGVKPDVVIGHSLGEYAALQVAGVLSASDVIFLVGKRAEFLEEKCQFGGHKMLAVRGSLAEIQEKLEGKFFEIACINGPRDTVLSGPQDEINSLSEFLQTNGYRCFCLDVGIAFHSQHTDPILEEFERLSETSVLFQQPRLPVISPLLSKVIFDDKTVNANYVRRATRETVNFLAALEIAEQYGAIDESTAWVEIGPHPVSINFVKSTFSSVKVAVPSLRRDEDNWGTIAQSLATLHIAGVQVDWVEYHREFEKGLRLLDLPTYAWNDKTYWLQYNGDWALTKGNTFYDAEKSINQKVSAVGSLGVSDLRTSTVQQIIEENFEGSAGRVIMQSDLMQPEFLAAARGHCMNGVGVVTSSIHADIAFTLGGYLFKKLKPSAKDVFMNITNLEVLKGLVAKKDAKSSQFIQVSATTENMNSSVSHLKWYNVEPDGTVGDPFASANILYGKAKEWLNSWIPMTHLIRGRMQDLERMASKGVANRFTGSMAYQLFASNLVNYSQKYRGMQSVILNDFEAVAHVELTTEKGGTWTVPPHFIDSVAHLAGFIMNVSDAVDTKNNFCVTPGWGSMRFAKPLMPGSKYRSYTKMIPTADDASVYLGDVYILQDDDIIGMVGAIKFRKYPRLLLSRFFSAPDDPKAPPVAQSTSAATPSPAESSSERKQQVTIGPASAQTCGVEEGKTAAVVSQIKVPKPAVPPVEVKVEAGSTTAKAIALIANEAGLELADLQDDATFANLGVDSLMSLVISEKFRSELGVSVSGSLFLEYPTVGDLRTWLTEYYS